MEEHAEASSCKWVSIAAKVDTTPDGYNHFWLLPPKSVFTKKKNKT